MIVTALVAVGAFALLVAAAWQLMALYYGMVELRRLSRTASGDYSPSLLKSPLSPGVSALIAVHDADPPTRALVRRLLDLHYGKHEVVLVLNGPSDDVRTAWIEELRLDRREPGRWVSREPLKLLVVEVAAVSGPEAYNVALKAAQFPLIALIDGRGDFIPECLLRLLHPFLQNWSSAAAVCGVALAAPKPDLAGRIAALDDMQRWMIRGAAWSRWGKLMPLPGSCVLVKRESVLAVGGFHGNAVRLFQDLYRNNLKTVFFPEPVCCLPNPSPYMRDECPPRVRPLLETATLAAAGVGFAMGLVPPGLAGLVAVGSAGGGMLAATATVLMYELANPSRLEADQLSGLFLAGILDNLGYRQLRNVIKMLL